MDLFAVADSYFDRLIDTGSNGSLLPGSNAKILLLDKYTTSIISMCYTQSQLLNNDVVLIDLVDNYQRDKLSHLNCIVYVKPTESSIAALTKELKNPHYKSYQLFFNNIMQKNQLEKVAESDDLELVSKVVEIFQDYLIINSDLFKLNEINSSYSKTISPSTGGLVSLLLSLKKTSIIRSETNSIPAKNLANEILFNINSNSNLFDNSSNIKPDTPPILLILDRKNDPITPLLTPWTYQSMIHELIGIEKNIVSLSDSSNLPKELSKITLNSKQDQFYNESMYLNFGDLTDKIKTYVSQYKDKTKNNINLNSLEEMKNFLTNFPEFKKLSLNVSKHLNLISELDGFINSERLWEISEIEQNISCDQDSHNNNLAKLIKLLNNESINSEISQQPPRPISDDNKVKLVLIYALRYENNQANQLLKLIHILKEQNIPQEKISIIDKALRSYGIRKRIDDQDSSVFTKATSSFLPGFKVSHSNDNIYMQHVPRLESLILKLLKGKLDSKNFDLLIPDLWKNQYQHNPDSTFQSERSQDIIVYFIGGVTYEEGRIINNLNSLNKNVRIVLGGDVVYNTRQFMSSLNESSPVDNIDTVKPTNHHPEGFTQLRDIL